MPGPGRPPGGHGRDVGVHGLVRRREVERPRGPARGQAQRIHRVDGGGDLLVDRWQQLPAVAHVDLDPVVLTRVMAGCHHHAVSGVNVAHGEGQHRGRQRGRQHRDADAGPGQNPGGVRGEDRGIGAAVVADGDAGRGGALVAGRDVAGQAGCHPAGHQPVHPHRARADLGPDAGRTEGQRAVEALRQRGAVPAGQQLVKLGPGLRVRVSVSPGGGPGRKAVFRSGHDALPCCAASEPGAVPATVSTGTAACDGGQRVAATPYKMAATTPATTGSGSVL